MYLAELKVEGFRKVHSLELKFRKGLNVLVGANNVGKTAVIDAIRALLSTGEDNALKVDEYDLHVNAAGIKSNEIVFTYVFKELSLDEEADFVTALKPSAETQGTTIYDAHFTVKYIESKSGWRLRPKRWCGDHEENVITPEMLEDLRSVYLPPLRDPASCLRPSRTSQIARLIDRLSDPAAKKDILDSLEAFDKELALKPSVEKTQTAISSRHEMMLGEILKQSLKLGLTPPDFQRMAARLSLVVESLDIEQNGLGYNNLIYMAVALSELSLNQDVAYKALIVEEPEAHLHPQLQAVLLNYLESQETTTEGERVVQVFVTSHSPNFASIAKIDTIGCIHKNGEAIKAFFPRDVIFEKGKKEKLERFIDATRAELFFARRIIFVEGAAEKFMISTLAKKLEIDLRKHSVSIISTEGLNFDCFLPMFEANGLEIRVAVISDADPSGDNAYPSIGDALSPSASAQILLAINNAYVKAFIAQKTFEYDLALQTKNHTLMLAALKDLHPTIAKELGEVVKNADDKDKPVQLFKGMFERGDTVANVQKGAYAQSLAYCATLKDAELAVPDYIKRALEYITEE